MNYTVQGDIDDGTAGVSRPVSWAHHFFLNNNDHKTLRQLLRRKRRALGFGWQIAAARRVAELIVSQDFYSVSQRIALYLPNDGEISLMPLLKHAWSHGKHCYLPVIDGDQLRFAHFTPGAPLTNNQFGILEPTAGKYCHLKDIDLVLTPLVAFDCWGNRLGMGGGFYDRTFASQLNLNNELDIKRPLLCGVAHRCQQVRGLTPTKWDFPLDWVAVS